MYGASYYAAEYYNAEYYEGGISSVVGAFGDWQPVARKFRDERREIKRAARQAAVKREDPIEEITLAQFFPEETFPMIDARPFMVNPSAQDEQDMEDLIIGLIRAGVI